MMRWLALALALLCAPAYGIEYKSCIPGMRGDVTAWGWPIRHEEGWTQSWVCLHEGKHIAQYWACVHGVCGQSTYQNALSSIRGATDKNAALNAATAEMTDCSTATGTLKMLCDRGRAESQRLYDEWKAKQPATPPPPPAEVWKVAPNGTATTRPTYTIANGALIAATPRATVGAVCDLSVKLVKGTSTYAAWETTKATVTLCRKA